eukprot:TRINITY_DN47266_c0_g1_i1.p1 TRINITY_DN47266_c0_g1~~TRINITY_DN47266_c0_g1_i1.p1  ORF type:complete len:999 (+),score=260.42 TRINITY_DN47266_c0_g1_i1:155-3151(+)
MTHRGGGPSSPEGNGNGHRRDEEPAEEDACLDELQRLRRTLFTRLGRLESQVSEIAEVCREEAEAQHELAVQVSSFQEEMATLRDMVGQAASRSPTGGSPGAPGSGGSFDFGSNSKLPADCREMEMRAQKAELELKAVRAEMELKAMRAELELRALRAEQELRAAKEEQQRSEVKAFQPIYREPLPPHSAWHPPQIYDPAPEPSIGYSPGKCANGPLGPPKSDNIWQELRIGPPDLLTGDDWADWVKNVDNVDDWEDWEWDDLNGPGTFAAAYYQTGPRPSVAQLVATGTGWDSFGSGGERSSGSGGSGEGQRRVIEMETICAGAGDGGQHVPADGADWAGQTPPQVDPVVVLNHIQVHPLDILGQGGFSVVRRGLDLETHFVVAVKSYTEMELIDDRHPQYGQTKDWFLNKFRHEVEIFEYLHEEVDMRTLILKQKAKEQDGKMRHKRMSWYIPDAVVDKDCKLLDAFADFPSASQLFVKLLDYTKEKIVTTVERSAVEEEATPGGDSGAGPKGKKNKKLNKRQREKQKKLRAAQQKAAKMGEASANEPIELVEWLPGVGPDGICYIVLELADFTLHEFLQHRYYIGPRLIREEVAQIFRQLAQIIAALHARNFVHADLKPMNVMHFPCGRWKLIDMDGMVTPGLVAADDICYTPLYVAPEMARQCCAGVQQMEVSRHLDVWSLGMCVCELVTLSPVLSPKLEELMDIRVFLEWIGSDEPIEVPQEIYDMDPLLHDVLTRMLTKDTDRRVSMVEVLVHPFFTGAEGVGAVLEKGEKADINDCSLYSRSLLYRSASAKVLLLEQRDKAGKMLGSMSGTSLSGAPPTTGRRGSMMKIAASEMKRMSRGNLMSLRGLPGIPETGGENKEVAIPLVDNKRGGLKRSSMAYPVGLAAGIVEKKREESRPATEDTVQERRASVTNDQIVKRRLSAAGQVTCMKRTAKTGAGPGRRLSAIGEADDEDSTDSEQPGKPHDRLQALHIRSGFSSDEASGEDDDFAA